MNCPAGIYVHLPYCRSRCTYCSFVVSTDDSSREAYLKALLREVALVAPEARGGLFDSVYLGGGTPSRVPCADLARLLAALAHKFDLASGSEVTLEANPEDVTAEAVADWLAAGVTRVSLGVQSLADRELSAVGRQHDAAQALAALEILTRSGLAVSGDLILGLPEQTGESFGESLRGLLEAGVDHVSIYLLETEKSRQIEEDRRLNPFRYLSEDAQADLWLEGGETLTAASFRHYEVSNWALPGRQARHNTKYWKRVPTLGLGVSAHEFWKNHRRANVSGLSRYIQELASGRRPMAFDQAIEGEGETRERIVLGLRLGEGVAAAELESLIPREDDERLPEDYAAWRREGLLEETSGRIHFTERGFLLSNEILCRFV